MKIILSRFSPLLQLETDTQNANVSIHYTSFSRSVYPVFQRGGSLYCLNKRLVGKDYPDLSMYLDAVNNSLDDFRKIWYEQALPIGNLLNQFDRGLVIKWDTYYQHARHFSIRCIYASSNAKEGKTLITLPGGAYILNHYRITLERCNKEQSHVDAFQTRFIPLLKQLMTSIDNTASTLSKAIDILMSNYPNAAAYGDLNQQLSDLRRQQESLLSKISSHSYSDIGDSLAGATIAIVGVSTVVVAAFPPSAPVIGIFAAVGETLAVAGAIFNSKLNLDEDKKQLDIINKKIEYVIESQNLAIPRMYTVLITYLTIYQSIIRQIQNIIPFLDYFCKKNKDQFSSTSDLINNMEKNFEKYSKQPLSNKDIDELKQFSNKFSKIWNPGKISRMFNRTSPAQLYCFSVTEPVDNGEKQSALSG
ncbi:hypothetical protein G5647_03235 [Pectobacterium carotovorum]|uniref:hypothetical protein n=1 Tax=Pectobacterium carotovorum TaxID=554 RepID=UPI00191FB136|nr:hypothetical protein [Pectobacterium carotovorum]MBL0865417.1 hypothetical protein [Pectobacterium carotovorum]